MKKILLTAVVYLGCTSFFSCTPTQITSGVIDLQKLENLCVTGYLYEISADRRSISFSAVIKNPGTEDAKGSIALVMGVDGSGLITSSGATNVSASSVVPYVATPVSTVYPHGNTFISAPLITMP